jgi:hypothetical protein
MRTIECVMDSNSKANRGRSQPFNPLLRFPEVWNPTLSCVRAGSATGFTKETIIPQKPPPHDNAERWRDAAHSIRHASRCYSSLPNRPTPGLSATRRLAHKFPHGGERLVAHTVQRRPGVAQRPSYLGYVGYKRGNPTRSLMSCNSNSQREIEVVGRVDLKHPPLG